MTQVCIPSLHALLCLPGVEKAAAWCGSREGQPSAEGALPAAGWCAAWSLWGAGQECSRMPRECCGFPPEPGAVITHSTGTLWDPAAAPALASPWHPERQYLLPGAELCSTVQKMGSCLPLLRTQLKSCSCKKPVFSKHWGSAFNCWLWF